MRLKKRVYMALGLAAILVFGACGKGKDKPEEQKADPVQFNGIDQVEETLKNAGWTTMRPEITSFHLWEQEAPTEFLIGETSSGASLVFGKFSSAEDALKAYDTTVPESSEAVEVQDTDQYRQVLVPLENNSGSWVFRTSENWVVGGFIRPEADETAMISLIESLQTAPSQSAPAKTDDNSDPTKNG